MAIDTVIFDLDGTLLNSIEDLTDSTNNALRKFGYPERTIEEIKEFVGNGVELLIERAIPEGRSNSDYSDCVEYFKSDYKTNMFNKTKPYNEVIELLTKMKGQGYKIAVLSNKFDNAVKFLCDKYFKGLIDCAVGQSEEVPVKPSANGVNLIMKELGVTSDRCIMVGDSEVDIKTSENSGIPCISVTWGYKSIDFLYNNGAEVLVYSPMEILDLI